MTIIQKKASPLKKSKPSKQYSSPNQKHHPIFKNIIKRFQYINRTITTTPTHRTNPPKKHIRLPKQGRNETHTTPAYTREHEMVISTRVPRRSMGSAMVCKRRCGPWACLLAVSGIAARQHFN